MLALYRCGRQAEALEVYREGRGALDRGARARARARAAGAGGADPREDDSPRSPRRRACHHHAERAARRAPGAPWRPAASSLALAAGVALLREAACRAAPARATSPPTPGGARRRWSRASASPRHCPAGRRTLPPTATGCSVSVDSAALTVLDARTRSIAADPAAPSTRRRRRRRPAAPGWPTAAAAWSSGSRRATRGVGPRAGRGEGGSRPGPEPARPDGSRWPAGMACDHRRRSRARDRRRPDGRVARLPARARSTA